jgi:polar amino acid transport system substrate-binding protein
MRANWRFILWMIMGCWIGLVNAQETFTLIAEDDWYPYSSKREGKPVGLAVDIVHAAYEAAGVSVELVSRPYARCMLEVKQGKFVGCFDTSKDALTEKDYLYHQQPLFYATFGIYARSDHAQKMTAADLAGKKVGLTNGYT